MSMKDSTMKALLVVIAIVLAVIVFGTSSKTDDVLVPLISGAGIIFTLVTTAYVKGQDKEEVNQKKLDKDRALIIWFIGAYLGAIILLFIVCAIGRCGCDLKCCFSGFCSFGDEKYEPAPEDKWDCFKCACKSDVPSRIVDAPVVIPDDDGSFKFIVFGDSRGDTVEPECGDTVEPECGDTVEPVSGDTAEPKDADRCETCDDYPHNERDRLSLLYEVSGRINPFSKNSAEPRPAFALFTGDIVYRGGCPFYWEPIEYYFKYSIKSCPPRLFPVPGNHETWERTAGEDPFDNYFKAFPCLKKDCTGLHYYAFYTSDCAFINLCNGAYCGDDKWHCKQGTFDEQMKWMRSVIDYGLHEKDVKNLFVQYHKPSYSNFEHPALAGKNDPLVILREYKRRYYPPLGVFVFNSHNHTTELYNTEEGVIVLVAGGGGAPQKVCEGCEPTKKTPDELFWPEVFKDKKEKIKKRQKRVNYFEVKVSDDDVTMIEKCMEKKADGAYQFVNAVEISSLGVAKSIIEDQERCNLAVSREEP
jgi:hypothetical protein